MNEALPSPPPLPPVPPSPARRFGCLHLLLAVFIAVVLTVVAAFFVARMFLFPAPFKPVALNAREEQVLRQKLDRLDFDSATPAKSGPSAPAATDSAPEPEAYRESETDRTVQFSERELNALLAKNTDLAGKLSIDLSDDLLSAKLLVPLDEDFPVLGGKILRVKTGVAFRYADGKPVLMLRGVSLMGVPLPNAWLGGLKNIDLIREFGGETGFWKAFADGIESLHVEEGRISITVKE